MAVCYLRAGTDGAMSPKSTKISISGNFVTKSKNSIAGGKKITKISISGVSRGIAVHQIFLQHFPGIGLFLSIPEYTSEKRNTS